MTVAARSSWLLTKADRANAQTVLDDVHPGERAWSQGKHVRPLVHGATYFAELAQRIEEARPGDLILFTDCVGTPTNSSPTIRPRQWSNCWGPRTDGASTSVG